MQAFSQHLRRLRETRAGVTSAGRRVQANHLPAGYGPPPPDAQRAGHAGSGTGNLAPRVHEFPIPPTLSVKSAAKAAWLQQPCSGGSQQVYTGSPGRFPSSKWPGRCRWRERSALVPQAFFGGTPCGPLNALGRPVTLVGAVVILELLHGLPNEGSVRITWCGCHLNDRS